MKSSDTYLVIVVAAVLWRPGSSRLITNYTTLSDSSPSFPAGHRPSVMDERLEVRQDLSGGRGQFQLPRNKWHILEDCVSRSRNKLLGIACVGLLDVAIKPRDRPINNAGSGMVPCALAEDLRLLKHDVL